MPDQAANLQQRLIDAIDSNTTYLALGSPTNAQNLAQIRSLTRQMQALLRLAQDRREIAD